MKMCRRVAQCGTLTLLLVCLLFSSTAFAATRDEVKEKFAAGNYQAALDAANEYLTSTPDDSAVMLVKGLALNRLGKHGKALQTFEQLQEAGMAYDSLLFEMGWAHMGVNEPRQAIVLLEIYEERASGNAQTSEFLGRCYFALGQYGTARQYFNEAIERDKELSQTAGLYLAEISRREGNRGALSQYARDTLSSDPDSPFGLHIQELVGSSRSLMADPDKRWRLTLSAGIGYNDNAAGLSYTSPVPANFPDHDEFFTRSSIFGSYDFLRDEEQVGTVGYSLQGDFYFGEMDDVNLIDHYLFVDYSKKVSDTVMLGARVSDNYNNVGGDKYSNRFTFRPYAFFVLSDQFTIEAGYSLDVSEYFQTTVSFSDRDNISHTVDGTLYYAPENLPMVFKTGVTGHFHDSDGSDFDHTAISAFLGADFYLPWNMTGSAMYLHTWRSFENKNSRSGGFLRNRNDDAGTFRFSLTKPIDLSLPGEARLYFTYEHHFCDSNVAFYDSRQNIYGAGIIIDF